MGDEDEDEIISCQEEEIKQAVRMFVKSLFTLSVSLAAKNDQPIVNAPFPSLLKQKE